MAEKLETLGYLLSYYTGHGSCDDVVQEALESHKGNIEYERRDEVLSHNDVLIIRERQRVRKTENKLFRKSETYKTTTTKDLSRFSSEPTAQELINAITAATGKSPVQNQETDRLEEENQELRQQVKDLQATVDDLEEMLRNQSQDSEEGREDTDDKFDDLFEEAGLDDPEL